MDDRFTVQDESAPERTSKANLWRLLTVYGAAAAGLALVLGDHYIVGTALLLWGAADF